MKIYLDLVFFLNFGFDFLLLLTLKIILKKNTSFLRILLGAFIGALSIIFLFLPLNSFTLFLFKLLISLIMIRISHRYDGVKTYFTDLIYLYFISIILGGFLYYLNLEFSYQNTGLIFFHNGFSINFILLIFLSPIILYLYIKQNQSIQKKQMTNYHVSFSYYSKTYHYNAYLDTGNQLYDPYKHRPVIILYDANFKIKQSTKVIYVPYHTLEHDGLIPCFTLKSIFIDDREFKNVLIGISNRPFQIEGVDIILHPDLFL